MVALVLQGWQTEAGREAIIGFCVGVGVTGVLSFLAHHKLVKPAAKRHKELLARHDQHDEHLKAIREESS
jgi:hypothetical protein